MCHLQFKRSIGETEEHTDLWIGYCAFHLGDYKRAMEVFLPFVDDLVQNNLYSRKKLILISYWLKRPAAFNM